MGSAMSIGLMMGGLNAAGALMGGVSQSRQAQAQADAARRQAAGYEAQAKEAQDRGRIEAAEIDAKKSAMRKAYEETQGRNKTLLGVGNVDMASGSALDTAQGNAEMFAADIGDNAYSRVLKEWETERSAERLKSAAGQARAQADAYSRQAGQWAPGLLQAVLSGASGFASGYGMAGGSLRDLWSGGASGALQSNIDLAQKASNAFLKAGQGIK